MGSTIFGCVHDFSPCSQGGAGTGSPLSSDRSSSASGPRGGRLPGSPRASPSAWPWVPCRLRTPPRRGAERADSTRVSGPSTMTKSAASASPPSPASWITGSTGVKENIRARARRAKKFGMRGGGSTAARSFAHNVVALLRFATRGKVPLAGCQSHIRWRASRSAPALAAERHWLDGGLTPLGGAAVDAGEDIEANRRPALRWSWDGEASPGVNRRRAKLTLSRSC